MDENTPDSAAHRPVADSKDPMDPTRPAPAGTNTSAGASPNAPDRRTDAASPGNTSANAAGRAPGASSAGYGGTFATPPSAPPPPPPPSKGRRLAWIGGGIVLLVVIGVIVWHPWGSAPHSRGPGGGPPSGRGGPGRGGPGAATDQVQTVNVAKAITGEIPVVLNALGTVTPLATVTVHTQIAGTLMSIGFTEGQHVNKGDFLAQVDPRPYQISLRQAEGTLRKDQALLQQAQLDLQRYKTLLAQDSVARQTYDDQVSLVKQYQGTVQSDQASIDTYKLDLIYAHITAPVAGRVGLRQVDVGNYVQTSDTNGVVVITQTQPMSVLFTLPEDDVQAVIARMQTGDKLSASAYDRTNTNQIALGALSTIDNQIDTTTGTVKLRALFANQDEKLFPNQFVNIRMLLNVVRNAIIVPSSSIQTGSIGAYVYLVKPDNTVTVRKIVVGQVDGERTQVTQGLQVGDTVVTDGVDRLREGAKIAVASATPAAGASGASGAAATSAASGHYAGHAHGASGASSAGEHRGGHHRENQDAAASQAAAQ